MQRLNNLNIQFAEKAKATPAAAPVAPAKKIVREKPALDVYKQVGVLQFLSPKGLELRKAVRTLMKANRDKINENVESGEMAYWMIPEFAKIGLGKMNVEKKYGGFGLNYVDLYLINAEIANGCANCFTFLGVHTALG